MHFSSRSNFGSNEVAQNSGGVLHYGVDAVEMDEEIQVVDVEYGMMGSNIDDNTYGKGLDAMLNVGEQSIHQREVILEDNKVPKEFIIDLDHNASREM